MNKRRKELAQLDQETLIEGYIILEKRVRTLEKTVRDLRQIVGAVAGSSPPAKTPQNSSIPSSQARKANRQELPKAKRGPKVGHVGKSRERHVADEIIECRVAICTTCGEDLAGLPQHEVGRHQVIDIPPLQPLVREVVRYGRYCPKCGTYQRAAAPAEVERGRVFGPNLERLVVYLHHAHPLSYARVQRILHELCGIKVSQGALVNMVNRSAEAVQRAAQAIRAHVKAAPVIGSDETGARVDGQNHWQWVFQTPSWVYTVIRPTRQGAVIEQTLEKATPAVWVSDLASPQLQHPADAFQVCLAHQVRDLQYQIDAQTCAWAEAVQTLFYDAMHTGNQRDTQPDTVFRHQLADIERRMDALLEDYPEHPDSQRLWRRYRKHRAHLFVFLYQADVPPTNNASEQALRNSVIYRKVTGGFRTTWGADIYANIISILETARRQDLHLFDTLSTILAGQPVFSPIGD